MSNLIVPWKAASSVLSAGVSSDGWNLAEVPAGEIDTPRTYTAAVSFPEAYLSAPVVHAALTGFDLDQRDSARVSVAVSNVTNTGFTIAITTWRETRVYGVEVSWLAIGN